MQGEQWNQHSGIPSNATLRRPMAQLQGSSTSTVGGSLSQLHHLPCWHQWHLPWWIWCGPPWYSMYFEAMRGHKESQTQRLLSRCSRARCKTTQMVCTSTLRAQFPRVNTKKSQPPNITWNPEAEQLAIFALLSRRSMCNNTFGCRFSRLIWKLSRFRLRITTCYNQRKEEIWAEHENPSAPPHPWSCTKVACKHRYPKARNNLNLQN